MKNNTDECQHKRKAVFISCFNYYDIRINKVIEYFREKGFETEYITSDYDHIRKSSYKIDYPDSIQLHVPVYNKNLSARRLISHRIFAKKVYNELCRVKPDIVYSMIPPNSLAECVVKYKKKTGAKAILDMYDMWPEAFPYGRFRLLLSLPFGIWRSLRDKNLPKADLILGAAEYGLNKISNVTEGVRTAVMRPVLEKKNLPDYTFDIDTQLNLCYLGSINHLIDIDYYVKLLDLINKRKKVVLHIIGEGENRDNFIDAVKNAGIEVTYHGAIFDWEGKSRIFAECDFGLNIYKSMVQVSMTMKSVEYLRAGLPFINNATGDTENYVRERNIGINVYADELEQAAKLITGVNRKDIMKMHSNCVDLYDEKYSRQDLDGIFGPLISGQSQQ